MAQSQRRAPKLRWHLPRLTKAPHDQRKAPSLARVRQPSAAIRTECVPTNNINPRIR